MLTIAFPHNTHIDDSPPTNPGMLWVVTPALRTYTLSGETAQEAEFSANNMPLLLTANICEVCDFEVDPILRSYSLSDKVWKDIEDDSGWIYPYKDSEGFLVLRQVFGATVQENVINLR